MTPEQLARRFERFERQIGIPGLVEIGRYRYASAYEGLRLRAHPDGLEVSFLAAEDRARESAFSANVAAMALKRGAVR